MKLYSLLALFDKAIVKVEIKRRDNAVAENLLLLFQPFLCVVPILGKAWKAGNIHFTAKNKQNTLVILAS